MRLIVGCRLDLRDGTSLLVYPTDRAAYSRLCRLLTAGKARAGKGACWLDWADVAAHAEGLLAILLPEDDAPTCTASAWPSASARTWPSPCGAGPATPCACASWPSRRRPRASPRRHRRRAVPRAAPPRAAGRDGLHPRGLHDRRRRRPAGTLRRPPPARARRDGAAACRPSGGIRPRRRHRRTLHLLAVRAALPVPERDRAARRDGAAGAGAPRLGQHPRSLPGRPAAGRGQAAPPRAGADRLA